MIFSYILHFFTIKSIKQKLSAVVLIKVKVKEKSFLLFLPLFMVIFGNNLLMNYFIYSKLVFN